LAKGLTKGTTETKICQFELAPTVDEQVLGLEISVHDPIGVAEFDAAQQLVHEWLDYGGIECATIAVCAHVAVEISLVHVLEDEHQFVLGVDDIVQGDYILVLQLFHQRDFADGGARSAFFEVEMDLLESHELAGLVVSSFEDLLLLARSP
jgi:hypothetical protein